MRMSIKSASKCTGNVSASASACFRYAVSGTLKHGFRECSSTNRSATSLQRSVAQTWQTARQKPSSVSLASMSTDETTGSALICAASRVKASSSTPTSTSTTRGTLVIPPAKASSIWLRKAASSSREAPRMLQLQSRTASAPSGAAPDGEPLGACRPELVRSDSWAGSRGEEAPACTATPKLTPMQVSRDWRRACSLGPQGSLWAFGFAVFAAPSGPAEPRSTAASLILCGGSAHTPVSRSVTCLPSAFINGLSAACVMGLRISPMCSLTRMPELRGRTRSQRRPRRSRGFSGCRGSGKLWALTMSFKWPIICSMVTRSPALSSCRFRCCACNSPSSYLRHARSPARHAANCPSSVASRPMSAASKSSRLGQLPCCMAGTTVGAMSVRGKTNSLQVWMQWLHPDAPNGYWDRIQMPWCCCGG
mmetsp:Transcript_148302/g.413058  ORF Transcript_148302/g.413058 Transcript_148302/m.413058 type:complete len:422 (+) Transcript_148302:188-1453(+)